MFPIIFHIGPLTVYSYGLMLALAVLICFWLLARDAQRYQIKAEIISDFFFWVIISGIIGGRIFYILLNFDFFISNPLEIIMIQKGGLAWQGGLVLGILAGIFFVRKKNLELKQFLDLSAPYIALGQSIGRIGCFLNGCCYGKEISWGIYFPVHHAQLHPTQLYDALGLLGIFFILKFYQRYFQNSGRVFALYLILAPLLRFCVEFFRADHEEFFGGLSVYQIISLVFILIAIYAYTRFKSQPRKST